MNLKYFIVVNPKISQNMSCKQMMSAVEEIEMLPDHLGQCRSEGTPFRLQNQAFMLTYQGFHNDLDLIDFIRSKSKHRVLFIRLVRTPQGAPFSHVVVKWDKIFGSRSESIFDFDGHVPLIRKLNCQKGIVNTFDKAVEYLDRIDSKPNVTDVLDVLVRDGFRQISLIELRDLNPEIGCEYCPVCNNFFYESHLNFWCVHRCTEQPKSLSHYDRKRLRLLYPKDPKTPEELYVKDAIRHHTGYTEWGFRRVLIQDEQDLKFDNRWFYEVRFPLEDSVRVEKFKELEESKKQLESLIIPDLASIILGYL